MKMHASRRGYRLTHPARKITPLDFERFDYILTMDERNYYDVTDLAPTADDVRRVHRMSDYCRRYAVNAVPDPYYGGAQGFENVLDVLEDACAGLLEHLAATCQP